VQPARASNSGLVQRTAAAKINLYLHIIGRRADGYHLLDSLIVFLDMGDEVEVQKASDLKLELSGPFGPELGRLTTDNDNLVLRAAHKLRDWAVSNGAGDHGAHIRLSKALPVAAGVGGGSADAAATLSVLAELWQLDPPCDELMALGLELGADVPACLAAEPVLVSGVGEGLRAAPSLPEVHAVLVNPGLELSTAKVFSALTPSNYSAAEPLSHPISDLTELLTALSARRNDLEAPAIQLVPEIARVLEVLGEAPGCRFIRMSGSGATCFGLFATGQEADRAATLISNAYPQWWVVSGKILNKSE